MGECSQLHKKERYPGAVSLERRSYRGHHVEMAHTKSRHRLELERRGALNEIERLERPKRVKSEREAKLVVATWNVRVIRHSPVWFFPTMRAALIARRFYLGCLCPGCGQRGSVDLRRVNRHPDASLESLIPMLSCQRCSPNPPFARLAGVSRRSR
jgi:hypothetical protein